MLQNLKKDFRITMPAPALTAGAALFSLFIILYWDSLSNLVTLWNSDDTYSHGLLIPFLTLYLLKSRNQTLNRIELKPAPLLLLPLALTLALWLLASITDTRIVELTLVPLIFVFAYLSIVGYQAGLILLTPLLYILVAVPVWGIFTPYFQSMAVFVNEIALQLSGISTFIVDTTVDIPAGTFEIEGGCAGIRFLVVTLALGSFYSLTNFKALRPALILLAASFIIPVIFNWIRIYIIILIGHISDMKSPLVNDHDNFGWVLYGISLVPLFLIAQKLTRKYETQNTNDRSQVTNTRNKTYSKIYLIYPLAILIGTSLYHSYLISKPLDTLKTISVPEAVTPWQGPIHFNQWQPMYKGASVELHKLYISSESHSDISLHIMYYSTQTQGAELISGYNKITDSDKIIYKDLITLENSNVIENIITDNKQQKRLVWYWYFVNNENLTRATAVKLVQAKELIKGKIRSSLVAISSECQTNCLNQRAVMKTFYNKHFRTISDSLSE